MHRQWGLVRLAPPVAARQGQRQHRPASAGNLGAHLATLEKVGYVEIDKSFVDRRPCTRIRATAAGRQAFARHVASLEAILHGGTPAPLEGPQK